MKKAYITPAVVVIHVSAKRAIQGIFALSSPMQSLPPDSNRPWSLVGTVTNPVPAILPVDVKGSR